MWLRTRQGGSVGHNKGAVRGLRRPTIEEQWKLCDYGLLQLEKKGKSQLIIIITISSDHQLTLLALATTPRFAHCTFVQPTTPSPSLNALLMRHQVTKSKQGQFQLQ